MKFKNLRDGSVHSLAFSAFLLCTYFALLYHNSESLRYSRGSLFGLMISATLWLIWIIHLISINQKKSHSFVLRFISCTAIILFSVFSSSAILTYARSIRPNEFNESIQSGLKEDCIRLAQNFPSKNDLIFSHDDYFKKVPASIKTLNPQYIERRIINTATGNACIMICLDGFAGFSGGLIVLENEQDIESFKKINPSTEDSPTSYERIDSCVYYLWQVN